MKYELAIAHRVCAAPSKNAAGFTDKFEMVQRNARSLREALRGIRTRLSVVLDGCADDYEAFFRDCFRDAPDIDLDLARMDSAGNKATFRWQLDTLGGCEDAPFVYFSEDDYLYRPDAFREMIAALEGGTDFVTPLDHPDRYNGSTAEPRRTELRIFGKTHWRRVGTTCLTFMGRREAFLSARERFRAYAEGREDSVVWLGLTKEGLFSPSVLGRSLAAAFRKLVLRKPVWYGLVLPLMAWSQHNMRLLFSRRYSLWSPIPSLAVHCCSTSVPPDCDWVSEQLPESDATALFAAGERYLREGRKSPAGN